MAITPALSDTRDRRIAWTRPLVPPVRLRDQLPMPPGVVSDVLTARAAVSAILQGRDHRLLVVVGPCSVHDPVAALDYAGRLAELRTTVDDALHLVMRVYFEKPRTTVGWKGLINDPALNGTYDVNAGLRTARRLLLDIAELGLPVGCEFLDPIIPQYLADTVSWAAIGARTTESQVHRQLASGLSMPVGIKNSTAGSIQAAVDAVRAASAPHVFTGVNDDGQGAIFATTGNADSHVVLRGGAHAPNHDADSVADTLGRLRGAGLAERVVVDVSHANSGKDHRRQPEIAISLARRRAAGEAGLAGLMLESFLVGGRQDLVAGAADRLTYGQSITDACLDWATTAELLVALADIGRRSGALTGDPSQPPRSPSP